MADGIERLMGNRDLYARMLRRFRREYQDATLPISHRHRGPGQAHRAPPGALAQGRPCRMIGAHRLQQRASQLENAIRT
ncbi:hypothetical protein LP420_22655 [Massilia sp. B-10]|nr:hypothetical protein LP420_22655 [Massilia sp. B-10]